MVQTYRIIPMDLCIQTASVGWYVLVQLYAHHVAPVALAQGRIEANPLSVPPLRRAHSVTLLTKQVVAGVRMKSYLALGPVKVGTESCAGSSIARVMA